MSNIYMIDAHDQVLALWRTNNLVSLKIIHLDFHCDMRGLLIDRKFQRAYRILTLKQTVDPGNFLTYAIIENRLASMKWVHGEPGGRRDDVGTVKYETDFTALPFRLFFYLSRKKGIPVNYQEFSYIDWNGIEEGEILDIDWDFFASIVYPQDSICVRVDEFLSRKFHFIPDNTYICYSKDFSHPSRAQWKSFGEELAKRFNADITYLPPVSESFSSLPFYQRYFSPSTLQLVRNQYYAISLWLRRHGVF